jgi:zinc transporter 9
MEVHRYRVGVTIVLIAVAITVLSLLGGLAPRAFSDRLSSDQLENLTGIASGLLLASALLVVIPEGFHTAAVSEPHAEHTDHEAEHDDHDDVEHDDHDDAEEAFADEDEHDEAHDDEGVEFAFDPPILGLTVLAGFATMLILEGFGVGHAVHEEHHDHVAGHGHGHVHHPSSMSVVALGLSVHALADGLAIGSAAVVGDAGFSLLVALAVLLHRVPAAFSLGLFALHETSDGPKAFRGLLAFALATPIAMIITYLLLDEADNRLVALALLYSAGTFVYVATVDTLPAIHNPETGRRSVRNVLIGAASFTVLLFLANQTGVLEHAH